MNKKLFLLSATLLSLFLPIYSDEYCHDFFDSACICECPCTNLEVVATYLFLQPNIEDTHYVLSSYDNTFGGSLFPNGKRHQNEPTFRSGFALEALYKISPKQAFGADFTFFNNNFYSSVSGEFLYDTNGFPGFGAQDSPVYSGIAQSKNKYQFYAGDFVYKYFYDPYCVNRFALVGGLQMAYIQFDENTTSVGSFDNSGTPAPLNNHLKRDSKFFGLGPELGIDYNYYFPCIRCLPGELALNFKTRGSLLCGYTDSSLTFVTLRTGPGGVGVFNEDVWRVVPSASTEIGLDYRFEAACFDTRIELGYLFAWYSRCVNKITGLDTAFAGDTMDVFNNFSLQGPYLRVSVAF